LMPRPYAEVMQATSDCCGRSIKADISSLAFEQ